jgi:hypothetical protein
MNPIHKLWKEKCPIKYAEFEKAVSQIKIWGNISNNTIEDYSREHYDATGQFVIWTDKRDVITSELNDTIKKS